MKFLIIKTSSLGDIIQSYPVVAFLRKQFPNALVDWVVEKGNAQLVEAHPEVSRVYHTETKQWRRGRNLRDFFALRSLMKTTEYDVVFDLQGNMKSAIFTSFSKSKNKVGFGSKTVPEALNILSTNHRYDPPPGLNIRDDYLYLVQQYFESEEPFTDTGVQLSIPFEEQERVETIVRGTSGKKVIVCPGSAWRNKQLPIETLIETLREVEGTFLMVWGTESERKLVEAVQVLLPDRTTVLDKLPLPTLQNLMSRVDLVFAMDSLPLHLAGTTTTPTFSVFGPSSAKKYCPKGDQHQSIQGSCPYGRTFEKRCPILRTCPTGACIRGLKEVKVEGRRMKDEG